MKTTIKTRKQGEITFFVPDSGGYVYANLNGKPGTLGCQICESGHLLGSTLTFRGGNQEDFDKVCRSWWASYLRLLRNI